jgi:hypothetical protein
MIIIIKANDLFKTARNGFWKYVYAIEMYLSIVILVFFILQLKDHVLQPCSEVLKLVFPSALNALSVSFLMSC